MWTLALLLLCILLWACLGSSQEAVKPLVVNAVSDAEQLQQNKFTEREKKYLEDVRIGKDKDLSGNKLHASSCAMQIDLVWTNQLHSELYSTPVITNSYDHSHGKQVILAGAEGHLSILDQDGHHEAGLPMSVSRETFSSSPLTADITGNGRQEIIWVSGDAKVFMLKQDPRGALSLLTKPIYLPKLKLPKNWFQGISEMPSQGVQEQQQQEQDQLQYIHEHKQDLDAAAAAAAQPQGGPQDEAPTVPTRGQDAFEDHEQSIKAYLAGLENKLSVDGKGSLDLLLDGLSTQVLHDAAEDINELLAQDRDPKDTQNVWVDAHVLSSPILIDVNGDGCDDLLVAVSYYFDDEEYRAYPDKKAALGEEVETHMYVAGGLVAVDLLNRAVIWREHLDLTTDHVPRTALIYGSPTVADLDGDGRMEVIIGTGLGMIYVMDASNGELRTGFPIFMDSVEGSIAVEDVNGDGALDMIAVDAKGNVFCFDKHGEEIWENHVSGFVSVHPTIGDINGDGILDVVLATSDGSVWALRGDTGAVLPRFPLKTGGAIMAPVTLVNLDVEQGVRTPGLHLVFASHDGYVYIVDGRNICANKFDLSEKTFAQILVDDVMGRGKMDLIVATMNGNVFCLATEAPFTPLKAWPSSTHALNGFTAREDYLGVYIADETKQHIEVVGSDFQFIFTIIDARPSTVRTTDTEPVHYHVTLALGRKQILLQETYTAPGTYQVTIAAIHEPSVRSLRLTMVNEHGQVFEDSLTLEFNVHYYKLLKWVVTFPLVILVAILYIFKTDKGPAFDFYL